VHGGAYPRKRIAVGDPGVANNSPRIEPMTSSRDAA